jgi:ATP-binding cassette subfamily B protein
MNDITTKQVDYTLPTGSDKKEKGTLVRAWQSLAPLLADEKPNLIVAFIAIFFNAVSTLLAPIIIAHVVDVYIDGKDIHGVLVYSAILLAVYIIGLIAGYHQTRRMGTVGRRILFKLRNELFTKLQELPIAFFNQNKAGDLISRINNDTDKLNQFFAQAFVQFVSNAFIITGAGIFLIAINWKLGLAALAPALGVLIVTQLMSAWIKRTNRAQLQALGGMSAEVQESLNNFKVIVAFNRLDYFREKFNESNVRNYAASVAAGIASNVFTPIYGLASNLGQLIVLAYGIFLISTGHLTIGLLIGYILYVNNFYNPLRQLATVWSSLQLALASLDRIRDVLALNSNMERVESSETSSPTAILEFKDVSFNYPDGKKVLNNINITLEKGKTYALVGPTGGGKTTTASLMARLFDPITGTIFLNGKDIVYGNTKYDGCSDDQLATAIEEAHLAKLIARFENGLATKVSNSGETLSLGQRQLIAFMRAALREPELLILDEATANIDTVTEQLLEEILAQLPESTTKVIIAHRLNTISNADEIFFVNGGTLTLAGSMENAVDLILHGKRSS